jgi:erythromycin esterase
MADNVLWALEQEGRAGRVLVFAHDLHVKNAPTVGGPWRLERAPAAMGQFLRRALGGRLLLIGTVSHEAGDRAAELHTTLARARLPRFLLDLRRAPGSIDAATWLARAQGLRVNGDASVTLVPAGAFDALVYLGPVTPARPNRP